QEAGAGAADRSAALAGGREAMNLNPYEQPQPGGEVPTEDESSPALDAPRVVEALEQYMAAIEAGEKPNRQAFLARHAEIAEALAECLDGLEALQKASSSGHAASGGGGRAAPSWGWAAEGPRGGVPVVREI